MSESGKAGLPSLTDRAADYLREHYGEDVTPEYSLIAQLRFALLNAKMARDMALAELVVVKSIVDPLDTEALISKWRASRPSEVSGGLREAASDLESVLVKKAQG